MGTIPRDCNVYNRVTRKEEVKEDQDHRVTRKEEVKEDQERKLPQEQGVLKREKVTG